MDREKHINTRNLVVCETFDDFAAAVDKTDFVVEDCVGYVISLANVYYWLNVETVWGAIGFTWIYTEDVSDDEAREFPHPYYRMKHVEADGTNIEMEHEWLIENKVKRGYGRFNRTTIPFTHIPTLPDGYRIMRFTGDTIQDIESNIIYIDKSDWRNLTVIDSLCNFDKTIYADFDGAPIARAHHILDGTAACKLYLKADLSNLPKNGIIPNTNPPQEFNLFKVDADAMNINRLLVADDYYKNLNIYIGEDNTAYTNMTITNSYYGGWGFVRRHPILRWEGDGDFRFEYFFNFKNYLSVYTDSYAGNLQIDSANAKYYLNNFINYDDSTDKGLHFKFADRSLRANTDTIDLTIDCTNGASDVRLDYDLTYRHSTDNNYVNGRMYPIKYIGNVTSIGTYNPYLLVENDEWPEFSQDLVNKLNPAYGEYIFERINCVDSVCPYTIDMTNKIYFRIFDNSTFIFNDTSRRIAIPHFDGNYYYEIHPTLVNTSQKFISSDFTTEISGGSNYVPFPLTSLKTDNITIRGGYYFKENTKIEFTSFNTPNLNTGNTRFANSSIPIFKIKGHESFVINLPISSIYAPFWGYADWYSANNETNLFEIDATKEQLMAGTINTYIAKDGYTTTHPVVICNTNTETDDTRYTKAHYTNFKLIYRANVKLAYPNYTDTEYINFVNAFEPKGDTETNYTVRLKDYMTAAFERLGLDIILANKGYNIVTESS